MSRGDDQPKPVEIFDFLDLRAFLRAHYEHKKATTRSFSYRAFSRRAGLKAPNHLKRVIDGERPLTEQAAVRYADALGLSGDRRQYLLDLATFARADTLEARRVAHERLLSYRRVRRAHRLEAAHAAYHAHWYLPAIRELATTPAFREDPKWIAQAMLPNISPKEARDALSTLEALGLLVRDDEGQLVPGEAVLTTGPETRGMHIGIYHRAMLSRAAEAIDLVPKEERDISSLTFGCSDETLAEVKDRIIAFRKELIGLLADQADGDRVVQLNFQLFPLTQGREE